VVLIKGELLRDTLLVLKYGVNVGMRRQRKEGWKPTRSKEEDSCTFSTIFVSGDEVRYKLASQSIPQSLSVASEKRLWLFDTARADKAPAVVAVHFSN